MNSLLMKLLGYLPTNLAGILGIVQALIKFVKEVLTACVNILFPVFPNVVFHKVIETIRGFINKVDEGLEVAKEWLLKFSVTK